MIGAPDAQLTDAEILRSISNGDEEALSELYDRYHLIVFGLLLKWLRNRHEAEDVLQDVFVRVWQRAVEYDEERGRVLASR